MNKNEVYTFLSNMYKDVLLDLNVNKASQYFSPDYIQVTDGVQSNLNEFLNHLLTLKNIVKSLSQSPFYHFLYDEEEEAVTLRYDVNIEKRTGETGKVEVIAIFTLIDGKIVRCHELTCPLKNKEEFGDIGRVKEL
ncbi:nuclear transport factor 2 family protein [Bacillus sp. JZ8]